MTPHTYSVTIAAGLAILFGAPPRASQPRSCEELSGARLPNTTIRVTERVTGGSFTPAGWNRPLTGLPPFCRVVGEIAPTSDSHILFEVWMPLEGWNDKFAGVGNGGWAGVVSYGPLAVQLRRGYATASTNTGHVAVPGEDMARFAYAHPEQLMDFAQRAHHETAVTAKALVETFYGRAPQRSYFVGCSSGGYEGLMEAQRFPADYDGIVAGAPANNFTRLLAGDFDGMLAAVHDSTSLLPPPALQLLNRAVLAACDTLDGIADGVLDDPGRCMFDPATLQCGGEQSSEACLAPEQVAAARRIYAGLKDPRTGTQIFPGRERGNERQWPYSDPARPFPIPVSYFKWLVFADSNWNWKTFDFSDPIDYRAFEKAESTFAPVLNATDPNLRAFRRRGGKLLHYHGWNDPLIAPRNSVDYYESVIRYFTPAGRDRAAALRDVQTFYRLYMVPGMAHCGGGPGPNRFDMLAALEEWVEQDRAPQAVVATHATGGAVDRTRPLCPYPQVAAYIGTGSTDEAANFRCSNPNPMR